MKISKDSFVKDCWAYITETLAYLKKMSGNSVQVSTRKGDFKEVAQLVERMFYLEGFDLDEGQFYVQKRYDDPGFTGKYVGLFEGYDRDHIVARFEVLSAQALKVNYDEVKDVFDISIESIANNTFTPVTITKEELPLHVGRPFTGALLQAMLNEGT